jgi:hypothetical protein
VYWDEEDLYLQHEDGFTRHTPQSLPMRQFSMLGQPTNLPTNAVPISYFENQRHCSFTILPYAPSIHLRPKPPAAFENYLKMCPPQEHRIIGNIITPWDKIKEFITYIEQKKVEMAGDRSHDPNFRIATGSWVILTLN